MPRTVSGDRFRPFSMPATEPTESDQWAAGLAEPSTWCNGLAEAMDDTPEFDPADNPEVDVNVRLSADRSMIRRPTRRLFVDYRSNPDALKHLEQMPGEGESLHGVISGKYALWDLVPAVLERTGQDIDELFIATLS